MDIFIRHRNGRGNNNLFTCVRHSGFRRQLETGHHPITEKKLFFQFSFFCNARSKNRVLGPQNFLGVGGPSPGKIPPLIFFSFHWIETRWINKSAKFGLARSNSWCATGPQNLPMSGHSVKIFQNFFGDRGPLPRENAPIFLFHRVETRCPYHVQVT